MFLGFSSAIILVNEISLDLREYCYMPTDRANKQFYVIKILILCTVIALYLFQITKYS